MERNGKVILIALIGGGAMVLLAYAAGQEWGLAAQVSAMIYAVLVTLFLAAQLVGFVFTQTVYVRSVENAKFRLLEIEGVISHAEMPPRETHEKT
jgi:hypothetical protein